MRGRSAIALLGAGICPDQRLFGVYRFAPNPCIGEISVAPFYAVKIIPGDIATYHGLVTDEVTAGLDYRPEADRGLVRRGQRCRFNIWRQGYPGAGATLGPAMTFGYICGKYLAERRDV